MRFPLTLAALSLTTSLLASACALEEGDELDDVEIGETEQEISNPDTSFTSDGLVEWNVTGTHGAVGVVQTPGGYVYGAGRRIDEGGRHQLAIRIMSSQGAALKSINAYASLHAWGNGATQLGPLNDDVFVVGGTSDGTTANTLVARVRADGLNTGFGGDGVIQYNMVSNASFEEAIAAAPWNNKIVVAGHACNQYGYGESCRPYVARIDPATGQLDDSFGGGDGVTLLPAVGQTWTDVVRGMAIQTDGGIVLLSEYDMTEYYDDPGTLRIRRLNQHGTLDSDFNGGTGMWGVTFTRAAGIAIDRANNYIVAAGSNFYMDEMRVFRLDSTGKPVATFDTTVDLPTDAEAARGVTIDRFGRIVVTGGTTDASSGADTVVVRLSRGGLLEKVKYLGFGASSEGTSVFAATQYTAGSYQDVVVVGGKGWDASSQQMTFARLLNP